MATDHRIRRLPDQVVEKDRLANAGFPGLDKRATTSMPETVQQAIKSAELRFPTE